MESVKISQLQELSNVDSNTVVPVVSNGQNYKASVQSIMGDNLKTINNISILGNGNIEVNSLPDGGTVGQVLKKTSTGTEWADDKDTIPTWDTLSGKPSNATQDEDGLMSSADKRKLDSLSQSEEYNLPTASDTELGGIKTGYNTNGKNYSVDVDNDGKAFVNVPWSDTNTTYSKATTSQDGLMSKEDKLKLDGLGQTGDYVLPAASDSSLGGVKIGYVTADKNYGVQLDGDSKMYVNVPWVDTNTTYQKATTSSDGLMSKEDKAKLDNLNQSEEYVLPQATPTTLGGVKTGYVDNDKKHAVQLDAEGKAFVDVPYTDTNATTAKAGLMSNTDKQKLDSLQNYSNATTSTDGLMSSEDKTKLDSLKNYSNATTSEDGLMSSQDKTKLNGLQNYNVATGSNNGLMSSADKSKLDSLRSDATNVKYESKTQEGVNIGTITINGIPTELYAPTNEGAVEDTNTTYSFANGNDGSFTVTPSNGSSQKVTIGKPSTAGTADRANSVEWSGIQNKPSTYIPSEHRHTVDDITDFPTNATQSVDGLMSHQDKTKLDQMRQDATNTQFTSTLHSGTQIGSITINGTRNDIYAPALPEDNNYFILDLENDVESSESQQLIKQEVLTELEAAIGHKPIFVLMEDSLISTSGGLNANIIMLNLLVNTNDNTTQVICSAMVLQIDTTTRIITTNANSINLTNSGDGTKYLSDDGAYKTIEIPEITSNIFTLNLDDDTQATNTTPNKVWEITEETRSMLQDAREKASIIRVIANNILYIASYDYPTSTGTVFHGFILYLTPYTQDDIIDSQTVFAMTVCLDIDYKGSYPFDGATATFIKNKIDLKTNGSSTQFLSADGTYKTVSSSVPSEISVNDLTVNRNGQFTFNYQDNTGDYHYTISLNSSKGLWIYDNQNGNNYRSLFIHPGNSIYPENSVDYPIDLGKNTQNNKFRNCYLSGSVNQSSDICLKENIKPITSTGNIELVEFTWKDTKQKGYGVIAQEVEKYYPELVFGEDGQKSVNYIGLHTIKIAQLENEIKELKKQIEILINK